MATHYAKDWTAAIINSRSPKSLQPGEAVRCFPFSIFSRGKCDPPPLQAAVPLRWLNGGPRERLVLWLSDAVITRACSARPRADGDPPQRPPDGVLQGQEHRGGGRRVRHLHAPRVCTDSCAPSFYFFFKRRGGLKTLR